MALDAATKLRGLISERIPTGGSEADTMFTDDEIADFLASGGGDVEAAAYYGWKAKAAEFINLADVNEGNSARKFSSLATNALKMVDLYATAAGVGAPARTRIRRIVRTGGAIT